MKKDEAIAALQAHGAILRGFGVRHAYLFGSVARDEALETSDIDIMVEFEPNAHVGMFEFARLQRALSEALNCKVDLVTPDALHRALKDRIMKEAVRAA